ncbi:MAG: hypothetical protein ACI82A_001793 [Candidatus Azotimanducaceae bacterium]|jgi:hypothetical protein
MINRYFTNEKLLQTSVLILFLLIVHQGLVGPSMENDGLIYASIAKHLAEGHGSFWFPYSMFDETAFHHHPPLALWTQSLYFRILGDHFWVENLYQVTALILILITMTALWREIELTERGAWMPHLLFLTAPIVAFVFTDNFLEVTLTVFTTVAVFCQVKGITGSANRNMWMVAAAIFTIAAFLSKGPVGLFPLAAPLILGFALQLPLGNILRGYVVYIGAIALGCIILYALPDSNRSLTAYIEFQWIGTAEGIRPNLHGRGYLTTQLLYNLLIPLTLTAFLVWRRGFVWNRRALGWLLIGLSASLPLLISPRSFKWYIVPCLPFFALYMAALVQSHAPTPQSRRRFYLFITATSLLIAFVYVGIRDYGTIDNDFSAFHDLTLIKSVVPDAETIGTCRSNAAEHHSPLIMNDRYLLYLSRYHSVRVLDRPDAKFVFCDNASHLPDSYQRLDIGLEIHQLYINNSLEKPGHSAAVE